MVITTGGGVFIASRPILVLDPGKAQPNLTTVRSPGPQLD